MIKQVYNRFTDEEFEKVLPSNKEIREDYLFSLKGVKSKESQRVYSSDTRIILIVILRILDNKSLIQIRKKDLLRIRVYLSEDCGMSNARTNCIMTSLRNLLTYIEDDEDLADEMGVPFINCGSKVGGLPKEPVRTDEDDFFISFETIMKVRERLIIKGKIQQAVFLMIAFDSAGRKQELVQIKKDGLNNSLRTAQVRGKGGKHFKLNYLPDTRELIKEWLEKRGEDDVPTLFITEEKGERRSAKASTLYEWMKNDINPIISEIEGKEVNPTCHSLRHSRAEVLSQGMDDRVKTKDGNNRKFTLEEIQILMNHSSSATTQGYLKDHTEDIIKDMFGYDDDE